MPGVLISVFCDFKMCPFIIIVLMIRLYNLVFESFCKSRSFTQCPKKNVLLCRALAKQEQDKNTTVSTRTPHQGSTYTQPKKFSTNC